MVTSCMITKRSTYGVHVMSQSILLQKQRLGHPLGNSGHAAEKRIERRNKCRKPVQIMVQQLLMALFY